MFQQVGDAVLDFIYPRFCINCQKHGSILCQDCLCEIDYYFLPVKLPLEPCWLDEYLVVTRLEGLVRKLIHQLKYGGVRELATIAGTLLFLATEWPDADIVTAVPLHQHRLAERGYNQAEDIARVFARLAGIPYHELLVRTADSPHQAQQTSRSARAFNIGSVFAKSPVINTSHFANQRIILIDDVCTTGITLNQCAKVLKKNGCNRVTAITLAHGR